jgi:hypothetical protein
MTKMTITALTLFTVLMNIGCGKSFESDNSASPIESTNSPISSTQSLNAELTSGLQKLYDSSATDMEILKDTKWELVGAFPVTRVHPETGIKESSPPIQPEDVAHSGDLLIEFSSMERVSPVCIALAGVQCNPYVKSEVNLSGICGIYSIPVTVQLNYYVAESQPANSFIFFKYQEEAPCTLVKPATLASRFLKEIRIANNLNDQKTLTLTGNNLYVTTLEWHWVFVRR